MYVDQVGQAYAPLPGSALLPSYGHSLACRLLPWRHMSGHLPGLPYTHRDTYILPFPGIDLLDKTAPGLFVQT